MIVDDTVVITNDALVPLFFPDQECGYLPGHYNVDGNVPQRQDPVIVEVNGGHKFRLILGMPGETLVAKSMPRTTMFKLTINDNETLSIYTGPYLFLYKDLVRLGFNKNRERVLLDDEYFVWSCRNNPFVDFYKGGIVKKDALQGKVYNKWKEWTFNKHPERDSSLLV